MLPKISLAAVGLTVGGILTITGFVAYALDYATLNLAGFFYGIPLVLGGLALKAAELKPIPFSQPTPEKIVTLRNQLATPTQNQIRKDVTRYRYGQEAHLDESLERLGLSPTDEERPVLTSLLEQQWEGKYVLTLSFDSPFISLETWQGKQEKIAKFFGPDLEVTVSQPQEKVVLVNLISQLALP
ncbi:MULTISPECIES: DUF2854 domain-containing protein [unclassified Synechocystis]|uniref:DUF2854 domain-containing protein n=1 Tax=unclassified Synechocystis TaxID=2640012 RepID=UPI000409BA63|nr:MULTISPECIES: DUF2854 domain-containing protein [unclassified Synechocystis]AIE74168.1 Cyanobacterial protein [Synechocystis sp. PCC 6714]MCT0252803.1 DUF2854 domain-containing protein [Synechocystis sp. CS-94]